VPDYCLELYLAGDSQAALEEAAGRARAAAESFGARGGSVRYLRSTYLPEVETWLHFFAAASGEDVAEAAQQAGLTGNRITRSIDADQPSRRVHETRRAPTERGEP
jgi:2-hydroxychromene-2-carboxylate isomerase